MGSQWNKRFRKRKRNRCSQKSLDGTHYVSHTQSGSLKATISPRLLCFFHLFICSIHQFLKQQLFFNSLISHRIPHLFPTIPQLPPMSSCRQYQGITDLDTVAQPLLCANNLSHSVCAMDMNEWMNESSSHVNRRGVLFRAEQLSKIKMKSQYGLAWLSDRKGCDYLNICTVCFRVMRCMVFIYTWASHDPVFSVFQISSQ